jgi:two-component system heavy metal sensor histidine kinase CusS
LRTPIQNLVGEAQVALSRGRTEEEYRHIIESSLEEYERLSRMINELLFLARADDPTTAMGLERFDVRGELAIVRDYHDAEAEEQGITVTCEGQTWLDADPVLFRRVLNNLLSNALRHTPSGGRVVMAARTLAEGVEIAVSDSGCGIAAEHLGKLGTRFYRPDRTAGLAGGGVGLGLAIVKSIMALHGGSVVIESSEGQGTKVILRFPFRSILAPENGGATAPREPLNSSSVA